MKFCKALADLITVRLVLCASLLASGVLAQNAQEQSLARQREAIQKQRDALAAQQGAVALQRASAARQPQLEPWQTPSPQVVADCGALSDDRVNNLIHRASRENALTPDLLRAVIRRESSFQPCAVSRAGAMGLMQLMPNTALDLGVRNPFDAEENVSGGAKLLRSLIDRYGGDLSLALGAYNAGPARVDAAGGVPEIPETQQYVREILERLR